MILLMNNILSTEWLAQLKLGAVSRDEWCLSDSRLGQGQRVYFLIAMLIWEVGAMATNSVCFNFRSNYVD